MKYGKNIPNKQAVEACSTNMVGGEAATAPILRGFYPKAQAELYSTTLTTRNGH